MKIIYIIFIYLLLINNSFSKEIQAINIATNENSPMCINYGGKVEGFSIDLLNEVFHSYNESNKNIFNKLNISIFENVENKLNSIKDKSNDIAICGITETYERTLEMDEVQIMETGSRFLSLKESYVDSILRMNVILSIIYFLLYAIIISYFLRVAERRNPLTPEIDSYTDALNETLNISSTNGRHLKYTPKGKIIKGIITLTGIAFFTLVIVNIGVNKYEQRANYVIKNLSDVDTLNIGTVANTSNHDFLIRNNKKFTIFTSADKLFESLENGEIDLAFYDELSIKNYEKNSSNVKITGPRFNLQNYVWYLPKGETKTQKQIELKILKLRENGVLERLINKWF